MKKIEAIIRTEKLELLKTALTASGQNYGMTVSQVLGFGSQMGFAEYVRGNKIIPALLSKVKVDIIVGEEELEPLLDLIQKTVWTGEVGDGKIFVSPVERVIRIRTGEEDTDAL